MINQIKRHPVYFLVYLLFLLISVITLLFYNKTGIHLYLNNLQGQSADNTFKYLTHLGDGFAVVIVVIFLLFISVRMSLQVAIAGLLSGLIAQFLKKVVFGPTLRPSSFFEDLGIQLYYVEGVDLHSAFSFPSGHSTTIFSLMTSLVLIQKAKKFDLLFILMAIIVAYSRIYLSQHFLQDIVAGSIIGIFIALMVRTYLYSAKGVSSQNLDNPLIYFFTKKN